MRILIDEEELKYDEAWKITTKVFAYTKSVLNRSSSMWLIILSVTLCFPRRWRNGRSASSRTFSHGTYRSSTRLTSKFRLKVDADGTANS